MSWAALLAGLVVEEAGGYACTVFRPDPVPAQAPVVLWGNGSGQMPAVYARTLKAIAANGMVVVAANTRSAGSGADHLGCLDWIAGENARAGSPFFGRIDLARVGAAGHSLGGGGALMAGRDPRVATVAALQPYTRSPSFTADAPARQNGPILLLSGDADGLAPPAIDQRPVFEQAGQPVFWATLKGADHVLPTHGGGGYTAILVAWFRFRLMDDPEAASMFQGDRCGYCVSPDWIVRTKP